MIKRRKQDVPAVKTTKISPFQIFSVFLVNARTSKRTTLVPARVYFTIAKPHAIPMKL